MKMNILQMKIFVQQVVQRLLLFSLIASIIQVAVYFLATLFFQVLMENFEKSGKEIISNYNRDLSTIIFAMIILIQNTATSMVNRKWFTWIAFICALFFYSVGWGENLKSFPIASGTLLFIGFSVIAGKFIIDKHLVKFKSH